MLFIIEILLSLPLRYYISCHFSTGLFTTESLFFYFRLQELEQQMVGGENKENKELKEKRTRRKRFAEERKRKLAGCATFHLLYSQVVKQPRVIDGW